MTDTPGFFPLGGGLDLVSPAIATPAGRLLAGSNYEPGADGYARMQGIERYDGRPLPSSARYLVLTFTDGTAEPAVGDTITGDTSTANGTLLAIPVLTSGTWGGGDAAGALVISKETTTAFIPGEPLTFATLGTVSPDAGNDEDAAVWNALAIELNRSRIGKASGSGGINGVKTYGGVSYCFRNSVDGLSGRMFRADPTGWTEIMLGSTLTFSQGGTYWEFDYSSGGTYEVIPGDTVTDHTTGKHAVVESLTLASGTWAGGDAAGRMRVRQLNGPIDNTNTLDVGTNINVATVASVTTQTDHIIADGDVITGDTSADTATVIRVVLESGAWSTGTAAGRFMIATADGLALIAETVNTDAATIAGAPVATTLPPNGKYDLFVHNFFGASNLERMYGANGVGRGFEFDGQVLIPVITGMVDDRPNHAWEYSNQLFFAFPGGSIQNSAIGLPLDWTVVLGAAEIGVGSDVVAAWKTATACAIITKKKISVLTGNDRTDFVLKDLEDAAGGMEWSVQAVGGKILYLDGNGLRDLSATQAFGGFRAGAVTELIFPLLQRKFGPTDGSTPVQPTASMRAKGKDTYRVFFDDGTGLSVYLGKKYAETIPFNLGHQVTCASSDQVDQVNERRLIGTDDGWVFAMDSGTSLDELPMQAYVTLPFNHSGSPAVEKQYTSATIESRNVDSSDVTVTVIFDYGTPDQPQIEIANLALPAQGGLFDEALFNEIVFDAPMRGQISFEIPGIGANVALTIATETMYAEAHVLTGIWIRFHARGQKKARVA